MGDTQDTPSSSLYAAPEGLGVCWIVQVASFHPSPSVVLPALAKLVPTAVQAVRHAHDTPLKRLSAGLGVSWILQATPFQLFASVHSTGAR
jgi:hypothetical protein